MTQEKKILFGIGIVTVALVVFAASFLGKGSTKIETIVDQKILVRGNSHATASESAKIVLVEFGDFQCPACGNAYPVVKKVLVDYSGKINFVFRNYPLPQHKNALTAAESAEAAGAQGKFWEMYDKIYENQNDWSESNNALDVFKTYAQDLEIDVNKFQNDVSGNKFSDRITGDQNDGVSLGVNATPTFYINGKKLDGPSSYDNFKILLDSALLNK